MKNITASILANDAHVPVSTVRHYTRIGLLKPSKIASNGYKVYADNDVKLLRFVTNAKSLGFTLKEIAKILEMSFHGESPCPTVRDILSKRIVQNAEKIKKMKRLQQKLRDAAKQWEKMPDKLPNGHSVCHLIESISD